MSETGSTRAPELSNYRILQSLGQGGMGSVFLGQRHGTTDLSVIKVINEEHLENESVGQRFLREAHVASTLQHDNIARLTDAGREHGQFYLVMEFIPGRELEQVWHELIRARRLTPPGLTLTVAQEVLRGLHFAHELKDSNGLHLEIVHRDLSPRNVMLTYDGQAKIIDFGLVRTALGEWRTRPGMLMGTLRYISPEQAAGEPVDRRADLYTFAVVLYELLSGQPLIPDGETKEILHNIFNLVPPPLKDRNPGVPEALTPVLAKALQRMPEDRFQTGAELAEALHAAAPELAATPPATIGKFVRELFPEEAAWADDVQRRAKLQESTLVRDAPEFEATRAGVPGMAENDAPAFEATRAATLESLQTPLTAPAPTEAPAPLPPAARRRWVLPAAIGVVAAALLALLLLLERPPPAEVVATSVAPPPEPAARVEPEAPGVVARAVAKPSTERRSNPATKAKPRPPRSPERATTPAKAPAPAPEPAADPVALAKRRIAQRDFEGAQKAILQAAQPLPSRRRRVIASCLESARFGDAVNPDFGRCISILSRYLEKTP